MVGLKQIGVFFFAALLALALWPSAFADAGGGPPATFTTINFAFDGNADHCQNGPAGATQVVNCNIYDGKQYVWLNGGPDNAALADGTYFFAVLVPGGQHDPNEGAAKNLSDTTAAPHAAGSLNADGSAIPSGDPRSNRTFTVSGGVISYSGTHAYDSQMIRLMPYDDTTNNGGVYILAICETAGSAGAVNPRDCKYDAFKVQASGTPPTVQAVLSGTKYLDANTNGQMDPGETGLVGWTIDISDGTTTAAVVTDTEGNWSFETPAVGLGTTETFTVTELTQAGFEQTGNTVNQSSATGGVSVALSNKVYTLTLPNTGPGSASGLNFGNIPLAGALTAAKTATPAFTRTFKWGITKEVDKTEIDTVDGATFTYTVSVTRDAGTDGAWGVGGSINISNPNSAPVTVNVTDSINDANAACTVTGGTGAIIPASGSAALPYSCSYSAAPASTSQTNTASITWARQTLSNATLLLAGSGSATAAIAWGDPTTVVDASVSVRDPLDPSAPRTFSSTGSFSYSHAYTSDPAGTCTNHSNTATFTTNTTTTTGSASATVKVCVGADLTVSKTATPTFTRTFTWGISKAVDKTTVRLLNGSATFNYNVNVTHNAGADSAWAASGTITVNNPNDWEAITANVSDGVNNGGTCTVSGGTGVTIPPSTSAIVGYSCTYLVAPNPLSGTNTATAEWDKTAYATPTGSATGTAAAVFSAPTTIIDGSVTVTDTLGGSLGTVSYTDSSPKTFTYSNTVPVPAHDCVTYNNTATFTTDTTGTTGSASAAATVCRVPPQTGALTMGFWQNKNGQGIILGGAATSTVCNSGTWLRGYAPFRDLSATATCSQVAAYVYNTIKAASSAGDSMNPMLKAQMLATSLDVYFSDAALGGNRINASAPVGGVNTDLTTVCKNIGTCSIFENVSGSFGGAASLTVGQMLTYAAGQSNAGGLMWYANVKATQELAKDAFDAINNQVAFAAP